jgi:hypothetical protein
MYRYRYQYCTGTCTAEWLQKSLKRACGVLKATTVLAIIENAACLAT